MKDVVRRDTGKVGSCVIFNCTAFADKIEITSRCKRSISTMPRFPFQAGRARNSPSSTRPTEGQNFDFFRLATGHTAFAFEYGLPELVSYDSVGSKQELSKGSFGLTGPSFQP